MICSSIRGAAPCCRIEAARPLSADVFGWNTCCQTMAICRQAPFRFLQPDGVERGVVPVARLRSGLDGQGGLRGAYRPTLDAIRVWTSPTHGDCPSSASYVAGDSATWALATSIRSAWPLRLTTRHVLVWRAISRARRAARCKAASVLRKTTSCDCVIGFSFISRRPILQDGCIA